jgi:DNA-binding response OmpR family regulator
MIIMALSYETSTRAHEKYPDVNSIRWHDDHHAISIGNITVALTATEYRLLFPLRHGKPVTYGELAELAYNYVADDKVRMMMDKHVDRMRGKLRGTGVYIYCVLGYGYLLMHETILDAVPRSISLKRGKRRCKN